MKRARSVEAHYPFDALPRDLLGLVLQWTGRPSLAMVSRAWFTAVTQPTVDWLAAFQRECARHASDSLLFTGPSANWSSVSRMFVSEYIGEITSLLDQQKHRDSGLRQRLSLFLLRALREYIVLSEAKSATPDVCWVNRNVLLQCALYYLRDLTHKPLAAAHFHPRDFRINFFDEGHTYLLATRHQPSGLWCLATNVESAIPGVWPRALISTTGMNHELFEPFVEDKVIARMMSAKNFNDPVRNKDYYGDDEAKIKAKWQQARDNGTWCHLQLELHCNGLPHGMEGRREYTHYAEFHRKHVEEEWVPFTTEKLVYDEELMLTGQVDMIYVPKDPAKRVRASDGLLQVWVVDWKFAKDLMRPNEWQRGLAVGVTDDLQDCKISHYRVQLLQYAAPLERHYQMAVGDRISIVGMHQAQEDYIKYDVPREDWRIAALREYRLKAVAAQKLEWLPSRNHVTGTCIPENPIQSNEHT